MGSLGTTILPTGSEQVSDCRHQTTDISRLKSVVCSLKSAKSFTLIELVFITLVLGILLVASLPRMQRGWVRLQMERTAFQLAQSLRMARSLAIAQGQPVQWTWNAETRRVELFTLQPDGSTVLIPGRLGHLAAIPREVAVTALQNDQSVETVNFLPDGTTQTTTLVIGNSAAPTFTISLDGSTSQVVVR